MGPFYIQKYMKYFIIAGEASGDLHGANLIKALRKIQPEAELVGYGGEKMEAAGMTLLHHYKDIAVMGFAQVAVKLRTVLRNLKNCKAQVVAEKPDAVILIDFPGFNLKIAETAYNEGIKVLYYIAPKLWASRPKRVKKVKAFTHKVYSILPFELDFFHKNGVNIEYVGNPLLDEMAERDNTETTADFQKRCGLDGRPIIACLAGSRKHEIKFNLPGMMDMVEQFPDYQFVIAGVPSLGQEIYDQYKKYPEVKVLFNETYNVLKHAHAAMITSGTATLEAALYNVPQLVCFDFNGGWISYQFLKMIVKVPYISLVNLMLNKLVVKELIQKDFNYDTVKAELSDLVHNQEYRKAMQSSYDTIREWLGDAGASDRAAEKMVNFMLNQA